MTFHSYLDSPLGPILLTATLEGLAGVYPPGHVRPPAEPGWRDDAALAGAREQLSEYFAGDRQQFDLPLSPGGTAFQRAVWDRLRLIPFGQRRSYGQLALELGRPGAARAVGLANGRNPISIVVPCHRVVGANGAMTGYAGGLAAKQWLLAHESRVTAAA